jgi:electron transfer flavoprotein alpha subunit
VILVVAEQRDGRLSRASWEAVAAAQDLSAKCGVAEVAVLVAGASVDAAGEELAAADVSTVLSISHAALEQYTPDGQVAAVRAAIERLSPRYVVMPHTYQTRDFAPLLAARLGRPLVTDVVGIGGSGAAITFARPMFQGKLTADVRPVGDAPCLVTVQVGAYRADAARRGGRRAVEAVAVEIDPSAIRQIVEPPFREARLAVDLSQAERIVSVGRGIKSQENIAVAEQLAAALGAEVAASRPICDNGWLPMERQIGSSGQTVAPKLYVALGISGAIQHLVGMKGSRTIVAINKDADAPIFEVADYGIVGDLFEIVPAVAQELAKG